MKPCARITVTFINEDEVGHQCMVHNLAHYLYPQGDVPLGTLGAGRKNRISIVPSDNKPYLLHCDIAQHMEKGMQAKLKLGRDNGDLPSLPGISAATYPETC